MKKQRSEIDRALDRSNSFFCSPASGPRARSLNPFSSFPRMADDPWLAPDKLQHFSFCAAVATAAFLVARASTSPSIVRARLPIAAAAAFIAGAGKELGDAVGLWPGRASIKDGAADAAGAAAALAAVAWVEASAPHVLDGVMARKRAAGEEGVALTRGGA